MEPIYYTFIEKDGFLAAVDKKSEKMIGYCVPERKGELIQDLKKHACYLDNEQ